MIITKSKGTHSERDEIIRVTCSYEPITLKDIEELIYTFSLNELRRIRVDKVRENIIKGEREFMFENNAYWDFTENNPYLYVLEESFENLDIDTMMHFLVCESLYMRWGKDDKVKEVL